MKTKCIVIMGRLVLALSIFILFVGTMVFIAWGFIEYKYQKAVTLYNEQKYEEAQLYFQELGNYKDVQKYVN